MSLAGGVPLQHHESVVPLGILGVPGPARYVVQASGAPRGDSAPMELLFLLRDPSPEREASLQMPSRYPSVPLAGHIG